jgi:exopolysaccharide production protein ExoQ
VTHDLAHPVELHAAPQRRERILTRRPNSVATLVRAWLLLVPLVYLAVHGQPSFMQGSRNTVGGTSLSAAAETSGSDANSTITRIFVYTSYGIVACLLARESRRIGRTVRYAKPLLLLALLAVTSTLWSQLPASSLRSGIYYGLDTLLGIYLLTVFDLEQLMDLFMMVGVAVASLSYLMIILYPQYGIVQLTEHSGVWQGIFSEKNDAAKTFLFLLTPVLSRRIFRLKHLLYAAMLVPLIAKTGSKTAFIALLVVASFVVCRGLFTRLSQKTALFAATVIGLAMLSGVGVVIVGSAQITALLGRDPTLTGRTDIWAMLLQSVMNRPLLGYGYAAFWTGMNGESGKLYQALNWVFTYAHNGLLEVWLQLGLVGLAFVCYVICRATRDALTCSVRSAEAGVEWLCTMLVLTLVYNLDEGTILFSHSLVSLCFVILCAGLAREAYAVRSMTWREIPRPLATRFAGWSHA